MTIGYKQFDTGRTYMAKMGDWRHNKDDELELDGIGGVNIVVKADVHRSGIFFLFSFDSVGTKRVLTGVKELTSHATHSRIKQKPKDSLRWRNEQVTRLLAYQTMWYGT
jgi:hypothetical protein